MKKSVFSFPQRDLGSSLSKDNDVRVLEAMLVESWGLVVMMLMLLLL